MRPLFILLALAPLAVRADCPSILEGLDPNITIVPADASSMRMPGQAKVHELREAVDVACGRLNFTTAFWSNMFVQHLTVKIVQDELNKNDTEGFRPLAQSLKDQYAALKDEKAKKYADAFLAHHRKFLKRRLTAARLVKMMMAIMGLNFAHILPTHSQIALSQATKMAFGVVETDVMKQARIDTAMSAIERIGVYSKDKRMAELFPKLYELAMNNFTLGVSAFEGFANGIENDWENSTSISHLEVVPAVETLYIQYNTLNNTEAKEFIDWYLAVMVMKNSDYVPVKEDDIDKSQYTKAKEAIKTAGKGICSRPNFFMKSQSDQMCFKAVSTEAKESIKSAFPELFKYLNGKFSKNNWMFGMTKDSNKKVADASTTEGSGEF
ncbi:hypothetical protein PRIPAC_90221 [Pristionchus pacificus]|uniref:Uncharacterized protein n=1 Tax=Pristionchus pacificus TaxID=54126 RepID=A0A454XTS4_PRIPA|nr:hypothetical protein PRIPAC_90221 [Pristionchus pacificus]|eukprot:PDM82288.1 hypothetical protein PRIPAC_36681 [Pristionchus pacificus]